MLFSTILLVLVAATVHAQNCGTPTVQQRLIKAQPDKDGHRIVGGVEARPNSFPWIVSLQQYGNHFCGGSLLRVSDNSEMSDIVLTAAHCVVDGTTQLEAVAGAHNLRSPRGSEQRVPGVRTIPHEAYDSTNMMNDIAIVVLGRPVKFNQAVQPICLPPAGEMLPANLAGNVAGWGHTYENAPETSPILLQVGLPVVAPQSCAQSYGFPFSRELANAMLCAGFQQGGKDSCQGDSGGPFTFKNKAGFFVQHGVVSFGSGCAQPGVPGVYARVSNYINWIQGKIQQNSRVRAQG